MSIKHSNPQGLAAAPDLISQVVTIDDPGERVTVLVSGQVAMGEDQQLVGGSDYRAQAVQIAHNLDIALSSVGASRADIVRETIFVVGLTPELVPIIHEPLRAGIPSGEMTTSAMVGVDCLVAPGFLIEVAVEASIPRK